MHVEFDLRLCYSCAFAQDDSIACMRCINKQKGLSTRAVCDASPGWVACLLLRQWHHMELVAVLLMVPSYLCCATSAGSYLYQWPTQRTKTHAALAQLLTAADAATGDAQAAAPAAAAAEPEGVPSVAAAAGGNGGMLLGGVIDSLLRELLAAILKQLTPQEVGLCSHLFLAIFGTSWHLLYELLEVSPQRLAVAGVSKA